MKSITIHGLDQPLWTLLKSRAESDGYSLNKTIKILLEKSLGVIPADVQEKKKVFREFCGVWKTDDLNEFTHNVQDLEEIDEEDWK